MKPSSHAPKPHPTADSEPRTRAGEDAGARERRSERDWRIGATQMAAPSTRRWRRAGRFVN